jgi:hypothetical protein
MKLKFTTTSLGVSVLHMCHMSTVHRPPSGPSCTVILFKFLENNSARAPLSAVTVVTVTHPIHTTHLVSHGGRCNTSTHYGFVCEAMATCMLPTLSCFLREHEAQAERSLRLCPPATAACPTRNASGTQSPASLHQVMLNTEADTDIKKNLSSPDSNRSSNMLSHQKPMAIASAKGGFTTPLVSLSRLHFSLVVYISHLYKEESSRPFEAYVNNGGTAVALRGPTYSIVAADTRLSTGYSIHTRDCSRVSQLTSQCAIATSGMHADTVALHKNLKSGIC